ncbi:MAG: tetratricopeptide repeat protein [Okeania sp. SIO2H7]|nr:tetratricopeptide repeat protein [Okeania sp. SIO2H7]
MTINKNMKLLFKYIGLVTLTGLLSGISGFPIGVSRQLINSASAQTLTNNSDRFSQTPREVEGDRLFEESIEDFEQNRLPESLEKLQEVLKIRQEFEDKSGIALTAERIALISETQSQYPTALTFYTQAFLIAEELGDRPSQARIILKIASINSVLGRYDRALELYRQALVIQEEIGEEKERGEILSNMGSIYSHLQQYEAAINSYNQALEVTKKNDNHLLQAEILDNLGVIYRRQKNYEQALKQHQRALDIYRERGDVKGETYAVHNLAVVYRETQRIPEALHWLNRALLFQKEIGDREAQRVTLASIAQLFEKIEESELAIIFYKQFLNLTESFREHLDFNSVEERESYEEKIIEIYRSFGDLLMREGRSQEAQHVIDLAKVEELHLYLRGIEGNHRTKQGIQLL